MYNLAELLRVFGPGAVREEVLNTILFSLLSEVNGQRVFDLKELSELKAGALKIEFNIEAGTVSVEPISLEVADAMFESFHSTQN